MVRVTWVIAKQVAGFTRGRQAERGVVHYAQLTTGFLPADFRQRAIKTIHWVAEA